MAKTTSVETKAAEKVLQAMDNHWFNPTIMARELVNGCGYYTQSKVMELVVEIIKQTAAQADNSWEEGLTSEALLMAERLNDMIEAFEPIPAQQLNKYIYGTEIDLFDLKYYSSYIAPDIHRIYTGPVDIFFCMGMRAKFSIYDQAKKIPEKFSRI